MYMPTGWTGNRARTPALFSPRKRRSSGAPLVLFLCVCLTLNVAPLVGSPPTPWSLRHIYLQNNYNMLSRADVELGSMPETCSRANADVSYIAYSPLAGG